MSDTKDGNHPESAGNKPPSLPASAKNSEDFLPNLANNSAEHIVSPLPSSAAGNFWGGNYNSMVHLAEPLPDGHGASFDTQPHKVPNIISAPEIVNSPFASTFINPAKAPVTQVGRSHNISIFIPYPRKDTFIVSNMRNKNFGGSDTLFVGTSSSVAVFRSFLKFDLKAIPKRSQITSATLRLYIKRNDFPDRVKTVDVYRLQQGFDEDKAKWKKPSDFDPQVEASADITNENGTFLQWNITDLVQNWCSKTVKNRGIMLKIRDEAQRSLLAFDSLESPNSESRPNLIVQLRDRTHLIPIRELRFYSDVQRDMVTADEYLFSLPRDVSNIFFYTFFVQNKGHNPATVVVQISPDNSSSSWANDSRIVTLNPGDNLALSSWHKVKWNRLAFKSTQLGQPTTLDVWFQSET